jgi:hypothetical protein
MSQQKLTRKQAIEYACHECLGFYADGKQDCENIRCPLYTFMKYAKKEPDLSFMEFNPSRVGRVTWEDSRRDFSEEQRQAAADRFRLSREK